MNFHRRSSKMSMPLALNWSHGELRYRVTPWPDVQFERLCAAGWMLTQPNEHAFAAAGRVLPPADWQPYLEFTPSGVRDFLGHFSSQRVAALEAIARCPALLTVLAEAPALTTFLAAHAALRGTGAPRWEEINAVNERSGIFGVLEWLGLPASRQTLSILHNITDPEIPGHLLEPLRAQLWEPRAIFSLQRTLTISGQQIAETCHALAA